MSWELGGHLLLWCLLHRSTQEGARLLAILVLGWLGLLLASHELVHFGVLSGGNDVAVLVKGLDLGYDGHVVHLLQVSAHILVIRLLLWSSTLHLT